VSATWEKFKGYALVCAVIDYGLRPSHSAEEQLILISLAWEDLTVALRGYGDSMSTGFALELITSAEADEVLEVWYVMLQRAVDAADKQATKEGMISRYDGDVHQAKLLNDIEQMSQPRTVATPLCGGAHTRWVRANHTDAVAEAIFEQLRARFGHLPASVLPPPVGMQPRKYGIQRGAPRVVSRQHLTVIPGGDDSVHPATHGGKK
jgi:hypothetical protein